MRDMYIHCGVPACATIRTRSAIANDTLLFLDLKATHQPFSRSLVGKSHTLFSLGETSEKLLSSVEKFICGCLKFGKIRQWITILPHLVDDVVFLFYNFCRWSPLNHVEVDPIVGVLHIWMCHNHGESDGSLLKPKGRYLGLNCQIFV